MSKTAAEKAPRGARNRQTLLDACDPRVLAMRKKIEREPGPLQRWAFGPKPR